MRGKFSFLEVDIRFDATKCKQIRFEKQQFNMGVVFSPTFVAYTKIIYRYKSEAPLNASNC